VEAVLDSRRKGKGQKLYYTVKWTGHDKPTEQPWSDLLPGSEVAVADFHKKYPNKPGPPASFKAELSAQMTGSVSATMVMNGIFTSTSNVDDLEPEQASDDGTFLPMIKRGSASAVTEQPSDHHDTAIVMDPYVGNVCFAEGDLWMLTVAGAPLWTGRGVMSRGDLIADARPGRPAFPVAGSVGKLTYKASISPTTSS
jgi:hypothetical protein